MSKDSLDDKCEINPIVDCSVCRNTMIRATGQEDTLVIITVQYSTIC